MHVCRNAPRRETDVAHVSRGLCTACYPQAQRDGTLSTYPRLQRDATRTAELARQHDELHERYPQTSLTWRAAKLRVPRQTLADVLDRVGARAS